MIIFSVRFNSSARTDYRGGRTGDGLCGGASVGNTGASRHDSGARIEIIKTFIIVAPVRARRTKRANATQRSGCCSRPKQKTLRTRPVSDAPRPGKIRCKSSGRYGKAAGGQTVRVFTFFVRHEIIF